MNSCVLGLNFVSKRFQEADLIPSAEETVGLLEEIKVSCKTAVEFMDNLLLYEQVDSLQLPLYRKTEDLATICDNVICSHQLNARELGVRLSMDIHPAIEFGGNTGHIQALSFIDKSKIGVVLRNLVSNALKFTPRSGEVTCSLEPLTRNEREELVAVDRTSSGMVVCTHVRMTVSDTGPGMTSDQSAQLFKAFVQFSPNELQQGGGSGIGLYLCHMIISEHGLDIHVASSVGRGTRFSIDFPLVSEEKAERDMVGGINMVSLSGTPAVCHFSDSIDAVRQSSFAYPSQVDLVVDLSKISILIVDDSPTMRKMLMRTLKQNEVGGLVEQADDGVELLSLMGIELGESGEVLSDGIAKKSYDVIIVDNHMPRMGGKAAVEILRRCCYTGIIVGHTGDVSADDLQSFCAAGVDIAFPKPFDVENFKTHISAHLNRVPQDDTLLIF